MSVDKESNLQNICTNNNNNGNDITTSHNTVPHIDVIWNGTETLPHFTNENCLPVIGSCQVSSILSTIENQPKNSLEHKEREEIPHSAAIDSFKSIAINVCSEGSTQDNHKRSKKKKEGDVVVLEKKQLYQEMVFFGCNLCPFICTKDSKISDHINLVHKNQGNNKRPKLKCPGCSNIFYHKLSLRSHLIHDHEVGRSDINKIVNGIVYVSTLNVEKEKNVVNDVVENNSKKVDNPDFLTNEAIISSEDEHDDETNLVMDDPIVDDEITQAITEKTNDSLETNMLYDNMNETSPKTELMNEGLLKNVEHIVVDSITSPRNRKNSNIKLDEDKKTQKCIIATCAVRMRDISNMAYHVRSHFGKIFNCLECDDKFAVWKSLQTHLWRTHNIDMELYSCDKCNYKTYSLAKLNNVHKLIHGDEKPFLCDFCGKGFKNPKQLRNHKIVHKMKSTELQHQCTICERMFADKRQLRVHMNSVHQKIKPFSCNYCGYKAASNGALRLHVRQHTGEKPFSCDSCEYTTADHNSLRRHKSRHSGIKKYKCVHCDYACIQSSTYKTHLKTKHPGLENDLMFSCRHCQFRTVSKDKYMIHIASHKEKKNQGVRKIVDIFENICRNGEYQTGLIKKQNVEKADKLLEEERIHEEKGFRVLPKKQINESFDTQLENRLREMPVALISKFDVGNSVNNIDLGSNNHCILLPSQNETGIHVNQTLTDTHTIQTPSISPNIQFLYSAGNILVEVPEEKEKNIVN